MNKFHIIKQLRYNGDSTITLKGEDAILATTDFSTKYIKKKKYGRFTIQKNCILVYSWTDDKFRNIEVSSVLNIKALSLTLQNKPPEVLRNGTEGS